MHTRFLRFTVVEVIFLMCTLAFFYALNPANRNVSVTLLFVLVYGLATALANSLVYLFNRNALWRKIGFVQKAFRVASAMVMTDAVFYAAYSAIHGLTGLWPASQETPSGIAIVAGLCLGAIAICGVVHAAADDADASV